MLHIKFLSKEFIFHRHKNFYTLSADNADSIFSSSFSQSLAIVFLILLRLWLYNPCTIRSIASAIFFNICMFLAFLFCHFKCFKPFPFLFVFIPLGFICLVIFPCYYTSMFLFNCFLIISWCFALPVFLLKNIPAVLYKIKNVFLLMPPHKPLSHV